MATTRLNELNNGIFTSWVPFTTQGPSVSVAACSAAMYVIPGSNAIAAFDPWQAVNIPFAVQCLPSEVISSWKQDGKGSTRTSLGPFGCPSLYTTATSSSLNAISTSVVCCPSDYGFTKSGATELCYSTLKTGSIVPKSISVADGVWKSWVDTTITSVPTTILGANVNGYIFAASTASSTSSSSTSSFRTSTSSKLAVETNKPVKTPATAATKKKYKAKKGSLGTGAIVGIVVAVVVILAFVALFLILRRKKRNGMKKEDVIHEKEAGVVERPKELATPESELAGDVPTTMGNGKIHEHGHGGVHELDGGGVLPVDSAAVRSGSGIDDTRQQI